VYVATMQVPCRTCGGPTIPPTPGRPEEVDFYCEACGYETREDLPRVARALVKDVGPQTTAAQLIKQLSAFPPDTVVTAWDPMLDAECHVETPLHSSEGRVLIHSNATPVIR
jgi:hypothetical protein